MESKAVTAPGVLFGPMTFSSTNHLGNESYGEGYDCSGLPLGEEYRGIGILYGKTALLDKMPPFKGGGDMILSVSFKKTIYAGLPNKFEAGTPPIAGAVGLAAAADYLSGINLDAINAYEHELLEYATAQIQRLPGEASFSSSGSNAPSSSTTGMCA